MAGLTATTTSRRLTPRTRRGVGVVAALAVVVATIVVVGTGPFLQGLASISAPALLAAAGLAAVATAAAAWRWRIVARGFGVPLPWTRAFTAYYRSQFLNTVLPGGVVGDVDRAYRHGREHARVDLAARAVAAERLAGQLVQLLLTFAILLPLGLASPLAPVAVLATAATCLVAAVVGVVASSARGRSAIVREFRMLRPLLSRPLTVLAIAAASGVVVAAHAATFVVAGLAVGVPATPAQLAVVALVVLAAAAVPLSIGGWGPREAVSAAAFVLVGLGAGTGLAVSVAFGVLTTIAVAPGAVVLLASRFRWSGGRGIIGGRRSA